MEECIIKTLSRPCDIGSGLKTTWKETFQIIENIFLIFAKRTLDRSPFKNEIKSGRTKLIQLLKCSGNRFRQFHDLLFNSTDSSITKKISSSFTL